MGCICTKNAGEEKASRESEFTTTSAKAESNETKPPALIPVTQPAMKDAAGDNNISNEACFGAGCYWGTEKYFVSEFCRKRLYY